MDKDGSRPGVKQSVRWVEGYERLAEMAAELPDGQDGFVQASCIVAQEMQPAAGDKPVEWRPADESACAQPGAGRSHD